MISKIISGGQTGADQGGLAAAILMGIPTGGFIPRGFRTEAGNFPGLGPAYGLVQTQSSSYNDRTDLNIQHSDGTLIMGDPNSAGSKKTIYSCKWKFKKPYIINPTLEEAVEWVKANKIEALNVAGNRESVKPGIGKSVETFVVSLIEKLREK